MKPIVLLFSLSVLILITSCSNDNDSQFNILNFGARSDGQTLSTSAIQKAINTCNMKGGGTIVIPAGEFITGTLILKSNVELHLEPGARLTGSPDTADYWIDGVKHGIIYAFQAMNIAISGEGEINGRGTYFHIGNRTHAGRDFDRKYTRQGEAYFPTEPVPDDGPISYNTRPGMMIVFIQCEHVSIKDVLLKDSPEWTIRIGDCDDVLVTGISIQNNLLIPNNDGIHCTTSKNIRITNCDIRAGDDAIIVSGFGTNVGVGGDSDADLDYTKREIGNKTGYAENVTVSNCLLQSRSSGIRVGYGAFPIRNCTFQNLVIYGSNRGIGVFSRDPGSIENIMFSDIIIQTRLHSGHWWGNGEPIHVSAIRQDPDLPAGPVKNIVFNNITATGENGIIIYGSQDSPIQQVTLNNIRLKIVNSKLNETYGGNIDLRPVEDLEHAIFSHDIPGLYANHFDNLVIKDFRINYEEGLPGFFTHAIHCENFNDLLIDGFSGRQALKQSGLSAIWIEDGSNIEIRQCRSTDTGVRILETKNISGKFIATDNY